MATTSNPQSVNPSVTVKQCFELVREAPVPYLVVDSFGLILDANHAAVKLFMQNAEGLAFRIATTLIAPDDRLEFGATFDDVLDSRAVGTCVVDTMGARAVRVIMHPLEPNGQRPAHLLLTFLDEYRAASAAAATSHQGGDSQAKPSQQVTSGGPVERPGRRPMRASDQWYMAEVGQDLREEPYRPLIVIGEVLARFDELARSVGVTLHFHPMNAVPEEVLGHEGHLRKCVQPLIDNAVRFAVMAVDVVCGFRDGELFIIVADDGPGIPPADLEHVILPYVKLFPALSSHQGLGLARARAHASALGGTLELVSDGRAGTKAIVQFPAEEVIALEVLAAADDAEQASDSGMRPRTSGAFDAEMLDPSERINTVPLALESAVNALGATGIQREEAVSEQWPASNVSKRPPRLLLATADAALQARVIAVLQDIDIRYDVVPDGADALVHLSARDYAAVVIDMAVPTVDGMTIARWIARGPELRQVRVLALSAGGLRNEHDASLAAGCHLHQLTGCTAHELTTSVHQLLTLIGRPRPDVVANQR